MGSANVVTTNDADDDRTVVADDANGDGFWMAVEENASAQDISAEPDTLLDDPDEEQPEEVACAHTESEEMHLDWCAPEGWVRDDWADLLFEEEEEEACAVIIPATDKDSPPRTELCDSGATRHISAHPLQVRLLILYTIVPARLPEHRKPAAFPRRWNRHTGHPTRSAKRGHRRTESELALRNALHAPSVAYTLVSLGTLDEEGYHTHIGGGHLELVSPEGERVGQIPRTMRRLYKIAHTALESANAAELVSVMELHRRMGHIAVASARKLIESGAVTGVELDPNSQEHDCNACIFARATRLPVPKLRISPPAQSFGDEIHTDVWGPASISTRQGRRYFVTFTDDATRFTITYLMRTKDQALAAYKSFEAWALTQGHCRAIKVLRSDRGGEYLSDAFNAHLAAAGTARKLTVHDTPQLNGVAERLNRTLLERIRAFAHESGLPKSLWGEALRHAVWLKNRTATRALDGRTPFEALYGHPPDLSRLRAWGCHVWVHDPDRSKLDVRAREARWLGFDIDARAHRVFWPGPGNVTVERTIYFGTSALSEGEETHIPTLRGEQSDAPSTPTTSSTPASPAPSAPSAPVSAPPAPVQPPVSMPDSQPPPLRCSTRTRKPSRLVRDLQSGEGVGMRLPGSFAEESEEAWGVWSVEDGAPVLLEDFEGLECALAAETADAEALEPRTLAEAKRRPDWPQWEKAIQEELATLNATGTWRLEEAPPRANVIGCKWVFKAKKDAAGNVARYKARLVTQGFSQIGGVDYDDTYAPVAKLASSRAIIAMANRLGMELHQVDIKGAYLNGVLNEDEVLYMHHPPGYKVPGAGTRVLRLVKICTVSSSLGDAGIRNCAPSSCPSSSAKCRVDQAVFIKWDKAKRELTIVAVHVDDCTMTASTIRLIHDLKDGLRQHVEVTDLGELHWMLGLEIQRDRIGRTIHLSQRAYIDVILRRFNFNDLKPLSTPMDVQVRLTSEQSPKDATEFAAMRDVPYREAVGALNWAALATRPDTAFAVATVARFAPNPGPAHWEAVKCIYRYLAGTRNLWLSYGETKRTLVGYADADGSMAEDRRAITGYAFLIDGGAVSWSSKRQEIVSLSTTESEYVAATHGMKEALWLRSLLSELFGPITQAVTEYLVSSLSLQTTSARVHSNSLTHKLFPHNQLQRRLWGSEDDDFLTIRL